MNFEVKYAPIFVHFDLTRTSVATLEAPFLPYAATLSIPDLPLTNAAFVIRKNIPYTDNALTTLSSMTRSVLFPRLSTN